jgi:hypothetical protein
MFNKAISKAWYSNNHSKTFTILTTQFSYQNLHTNLEIKQHNLNNHNSILLPKLTYQSWNQNNTIWTITTQFSYQNLHTNLEIETTQLEQTTNVEVTCWTIKLVAKTNPSFILVQCNWWATWIKLLLHIFMIQWLDHNMIIHEIENEWGKKI